MSRWRFHRPPGALRIAKLDNLVLVPASLLSNMATYQAAANRLPRGQVLIILPSVEGAPRRVLQNAAAQMRSHGHLVTTFVAGSLG
jgi:hypothetical protein